jgi:protein subunit release factor A
MESVTVEIRPAEGGKDAVLLAEDMAAIYLKACRKRGFASEGYS